MPNKNKKKGKIVTNNKNNKRSSQSVKTKKLLKQSNSALNILNKKIRKKPSLDKDKNSEEKTVLNNEKNSFFTSIKDIISIKNEMDFLNSHLDIKFKYNHYYNNILSKNNINNNNYFSENKTNYNIQSYFSNRNSIKENSSINRSKKMKAMDNLYLYKKNNNSYKIYQQPELLSSRPFNYKLNQNSFFNSKYTNKKLNRNSY